MRPAVSLLAICCFFASGSDFREALPGYRFEFPRDHFNHPEFRTEWWYYTGNVKDAGGHRYGFELVFFRQGQRRGPVDNPSAWRVDDLYLAHLAVTDIDGGRFRSYQRLNRAGPGIAGILSPGMAGPGGEAGGAQTGRIWNGNWESRWNTSTGAQTLSAVAEEIRFTLHLNPRKPPVINGENGVSQKAAGPGKASYYVSFPLLAVDGALNGKPVTGTAWMDHEWFTHQLESVQAGWDWFSVQLENNTELMLFQLRRLDGSIDPYSAGTYIDAAGRARHLRRSDFELQPIEYWQSPATHARYPVRWRIVVPPLGIRLECAATLKNQELVAENAGPTYWEGAVTYRGPSFGVGYLEMTGYAQPMRLD
jgi:predicted secreted hydrolase